MLSDPCVADPPVRNKAMLFHTCSVGKLSPGLCVGTCSFQESHAFDIQLTHLSCQDYDAQETMDCSVSSTSNRTDEQCCSLPDLLSSAEVLFDDLLAGSISTESLKTSDIILQIHHRIKKSQDVLQTRPTALLWLQYMYLDMVSLSKHSSNLIALETGSFTEKYFRKCCHIRELLVIITTLSPPSYICRSCITLKSNIQTFFDTSKIAFMLSEDQKDFGKVSLQIWL